MRPTVLLLGLLASSSFAEPRHLPPGLNAVRIHSGEARLILPGATQPEDAPTLLPPGVFFNESGYTALEASTLKLQDDLAAVRASLAAAKCEPLVLPPPPALPSRGWSGTTVVLVGAAGVVVGVVGAVVLHGWASGGFR